MSRLSSIQIAVGEPQPKRTPTNTKGPTVTYQLRDNKQVPLAVEALDSEDNPADVSVAWSVDDDTIVALTGDPAGKAVKAVASPGAGGLGSTTVRVLVTDNSDGDTHEGTFEIEVIASDAIAVLVSAGEAEDKDVAPPVEPPAEGGGEGTTPV